MNDREELLRRIAALEALVAEQAQIIAEQKARIEELDAELRRRGKNYRPKANSLRNTKSGNDRRTVGERKHPGQTRPETPPAGDAIHYDCYVECCPHCGGHTAATGEFDDKYVTDIPELKVVTHRYRRHVCRCRDCGLESRPRTDLDLPGGTVGPRTKLLSTCLPRQSSDSEFGAA